MIATTLEQSKKLVELGIDSNTADMSWYQPNIMYPYELHTKYKGHGVMTDGSDSLIPAWSLSALLELLPQNNEMWKTKEGRWIIAGDLHDVIADTPLKAIYKMIVWLKENKEI